METLNTILENRFIKQPKTEPSLHSPYPAIRLWWDRSLSLATFLDAAQKQAHLPAYIEFGYLEGIKDSSYIPYISQDVVDFLRAQGLQPIVSFQQIPISYSSHGSKNQDLSQLVLVDELSFVPLSFTLIIGFIGYLLNDCPTGCLALQSKNQI